MKIRINCFLNLIGFLLLICVSTLAQTSESRQSTPEIDRNLPQNANSVDLVANEIALLRKSVETLNARLREISSKLSSPNLNQRSSSTGRQNQLSEHIELLSRAEQRAELLRKQLLELVEKEAALKGRLVQIDEDMRPETIERTMTLAGSTRTSEIRDVRRRVLENERRGVESLLSLTSHSRSRLDDDVRQADHLVSRLRQRLFPLIETEIEKMDPH